MPNIIPKPPTRVVLDTNNIMDMLHFGDPRTAALREAVAGQRIQCFSDSSCLAELERVAAYPQFRLRDDEQRALLLTYRGIVTQCEPENDSVAPTLPRCRDADDQKFLELAARCGARMLVTRDKELLRLARPRRVPAPFAIVNAEDAGRLLLELAPEDPAHRV
jgi:putative PIN family toxin of toxin-antitoxin system